MPESKDAVQSELDAKPDLKPDAGLIDDFSDFGDSDEDLLNKDIAPDPADHDNPPAEDVADEVDEAKKSELEGISDEDFANSDEEDSTKKARFEDALGVDWSQLCNMQKQQKDDVKFKSRRSQWTPVAIFNRLGLSKKYLGDQYDAIVKMIEDSAQGNGVQTNARMFSNEVISFSCRGRKIRVIARGPGDPLRHEKVQREKEKSLQRRSICQSHFRPGRYCNQVSCLAQ